MASATIENLGEAWPFPRASDGSRWWESTEAHREYGLNVLPPIYFPGGFFVSEPSDHDARGVPIYQAWVRMGGRVFTRAIPEDGHAAALAELREALAVRS